MPNIGTRRTKVISASVSPSATAYAAGDLVGGLITFEDVIEADYGGGLIVHSSIVDLAKQSAALKLMLFNGSLSTGTGTTLTDNEAADIGDSDIKDKYIGHLTFTTGEYVVLSDNSAATNAEQISFYLPSGRDLYGVLVTQGTPTYTSGEVITVKLGIEIDDF